MKNLKTTIALLAILIFASSCSKSDDAVPEPPVAGIYRIKEYRNSRDEAYYKNEYDNQNRVVKSIQTGGIITANTYNSNGLLEKTVYSGNAELENNYTKTFSYDSNKLITEEIYTPGGVNGKTKIVYTNNTVVCLSSIKYYYDSINNSWKQLDNKKIYSYNANNLVINESQEDFQQGTAPNVYTQYGRQRIRYTYDTRGNYSNVKTYQRKLVGLNYSGDEYLYSDANYVYDNIKPVNYPNSTLYKNNVIEGDSKEYKEDGTENVPRSYNFKYKYEYTPAGNVTKFFLADNTLLYSIVLEKIQ